jgi:ribosomal protein S24E
METKITSLKNNPLLDRRDAEVEVDHTGEATPSKEDIKNRVAAEEDLNSDEIEVVSVYTGYGKNLSKAFLHVTQEMDLEEYEDQVEETIEQEPETEEATETEGTGSSDADYEEIVSGTIGDAKDALNDMDSPDYDAALEAEKANKNRTTLVDWLESQ